MSAENEIPPDFFKQHKEATMEIPKTLVSTSSIYDRLIMQDHNKREAAGERTFPGSVKRCSLRERAPPNLFVPTHSRPGQRFRRRPPKQRSHASQPLRRGPGRPPKQRSDESPASRPLRRRPGRPRKHRSDESPAVSPPAPPSGSTGDVPVQFSATTNAPGPPLGSSSYRPLDIPSSGEEEEERETKLKLNPLFRLKKPPKTNDTPEMLDEKMKKVIFEVLVQKLLTSGNDVDCMIRQANTTFTYLKGFGVDYGSFYRDVTEYIEHCYNLHDAKREETLLSFSVWRGNYLNAIRSVNDAEEVIIRTRGEHKKVKKKMGILEMQIEDLKQEDERLKRDIIKYKEAHEVAEAKRQELGTQLEAAQAKLREIKQRKNAALVGIESTYH